MCLWGRLAKSKVVHTSLGVIGRVYLCVWTSVCIFLRPSFGSREIGYVSFITGPPLLADKRTKNDGTLQVSSQQPLFEDLTHTFLSIMKGVPGFALIMKLMKL